MVFLRFSCGFPMVFLWFSYEFPMVFRWFSYGFLIFFLLFSMVFCGFPIVFLRFSYGFPTVFLWFAARESNPGKEAVTRRCKCRKSGNRREDIVKDDRLRRCYCAAMVRSIHRGEQPCPTAVCGRQGPCRGAPPKNTTVQRLAKSCPTPWRRCQHGRTLLAASGFPLCNPFLPTFAFHPARFSGGVNFEVNSLAHFGFPP